MRRAALLAAILIAGCASPEIVSPGPPDKPVRVVAGCAETNWQSGSYAGFSVRFATGLEEDARRLSGFTEQVFANLDQTFAEQGGRALIEEYDILLTIYAVPNRYANPGRMTLDIRREQNRRIAEVHVLAPSCHAVKGMTLIGAPYDDEYFYKVIAHEIGSLYLLGVTENKATGWTLNESPRWFNEGYQEYLGLTNSSAFTRHTIQQKYVDAVKNSKDRVRVEIHVENPYLDGANILRFLHEQYGAGAVQGLLESHSQTFWGALREKFGLGPAEFVDAYQTWLAGK